MTATPIALNFHKDAFSFALPPYYLGTPTVQSEYPQLDGDLSWSEMHTLIAWLAHRSLWHVARNWFKLRALK